MLTKKAWEPTVTDGEAIESISRAAKALKGSQRLTEHNVARRASMYPKSRGVEAMLRLIRDMSDRDRVSLGIGVSESSTRKVERLRPKVRTTPRSYHKRA